jgi:hypothetical protein
MVSQTPVVARTQVTKYFSLLDKTKVKNLKLSVSCRSRNPAYSQVRWPKFTEPSSDRSPVGSIAAGSRSRLWHA